MSLEVGLPTNTVAANSGGAFGRKSGRAASDDSDFTAGMVGFSAVLAQVDDSTSAIEDTDKARDRRRKPDEKNASSAVPASAGPENSAPSVNAFFAEGALVAKPLDDGLSSVPNERLANDLAAQLVHADGATVSDTTGSVAGSMHGLDTGLLKESLSFATADLPETALETDAGFELPYAEFAESALKSVQEPKPDSAKAVSQSATAIGAANSDLVAPKLSNALAIAKSKLTREKMSEAVSQGNDAGTLSGPAVRSEDGSFRARISQEIKLLTQQAGLSREVLDSQQHAVVELEPPKYGKTTSDFNLLTSEPRGEANGQVTELGMSPDSASANSPVDGFLATAADLDSSSSYWISGDLKNAKMKLGDATDGVVEVSIRLQGNQAQVAFTADEAVTRHALQDSGSELAEMLRRDGIELSGVSVGNSGPGDGGGNRERSGSQNSRSTPLKVVASIAESLPSAGLSGSAQRLDLFV